MADQPTQPDRGNRQLLTKGAIPRMGLNIPVPPATKPPPVPVSTKPATSTKPTK
jgi:hypothetical protein